MRPRDVVLCALSLAACGAQRESAEPERVASTHAAAALVEGQPIALEDVERLVRASGLAPREALARLIAERLLVRYAAERGYGGSDAVRRGAKQASVQALLAAEVEAALPAEAVDARRDRLAALLSALARKTHVTYHEEIVRKALADEPGSAQGASAP